MKKRIISLLLTTLFLISFMSFRTLAVDTLSSAPNARVNYSYSNGVTAGTIRYMSQKESSGYFYSAYWDDWISKRIPDVYSGPGAECGTCSMSMALSYIGVNKTPKNILDRGNGWTCWDWDGTTRYQPSVLSGMSNYINGGGKYSPVVICLSGAGAYNSYTGTYNDHYIVLAGRISGETYHYLDPASDYLGTTTISGSSATYKSSSYTLGTG